MITTKSVVSRQSARFRTARSLQRVIQGQNWPDNSPGPTQRATKPSCLNNRRIFEGKDRVVDELREALKAQEAQTTEVRRKIEAETAQAKQTSMLMAEALQQERDKVEELRLALAALRREARRRRRPPARQTVRSPG